jgi:phage-related protein (TIGR01555 family)
MDGLEKLSRMDGWLNYYTQVGDPAADKAVLTQLVTDSALDRTTLEDLFHQDSLARRICTIRPSEMLRGGFGIEISDEDFPVEASVVEEACEKWNLASLIREAAIWGNAYGGAVLLVAANDGADMASPVKGDAIKSIAGFTVLDAFAILPSTYYGDVYAEHYGDPETYELQSGDPKAHMGQMSPAQAAAVVKAHGAKVHESRVIRFRGALTSAWKQQINQGWDLSVLQELYADLVDYNATWRSVAHLVSDASQGVFRMKYLLDMLAAGKEAAIRTRLQAIELGRSVMRSMVIDADGEDFSRIATSFAGLNEVLQAAAQRIAGATGIPLTVLMGVSPAGLNATGASDIRLFYDTIQAKRETELRPLVERAVWFIMSAKDGPTKGAVPKKWRVTFPALWQESPAEEAQSRQVVAQTDVLYQTMGALTVEDVVRSRFEGGYHTGYTVNVDAVLAELEAKRKRAEALAAKLASSPPVAKPPQLVPRVPATGEGETGEGTPAAPGQTKEEPAE